MQTRKKLSTTIDARNFEYLQEMVSAGKAASVGDAVDKAIVRMRKLDNRIALEHQTAAYFSRLSRESALEESALETAVSEASMQIDPDQP